MDGTDAEKDHMDVKRNRETVYGKTQKWQLHSFYIGEENNYVSSRLA